MRSIEPDRRSRVSHTFAFCMAALGSLVAMSHRADAQLDSVLRDMLGRIIPPTASPAPAYPRPTYQPPAYQPPAYQQRPNYPPSSYPQPGYQAPYPPGGYAQPYQAPPRPSSPVVQAPRPQAPPTPDPQTVAEIQQLLGELGYDPGPADGSAGGRTAVAIRAFQRDRGQNQTGEVGPATLASIRAARRTQVRAASAPGVSPTPTVTAMPATVQDPGSTVVQSAARRWGMPTAHGLPVLDLSQKGDAFLRTSSEMWSEQLAGLGRPKGMYVVSPQEAGIARGIRALALAAQTPAPVLSDIEVRALACTMLEPEARAASFGRNQAYGYTNDVCGTLYQTDDANRSISMSAATRVAVREGAATFRTRDLPRILADAPRLPLKILVRWPAPIDRSYQPRPGGYSVSDAFAGRHSLLGTPLDVTQPQFWPVGETAAAAFEARRRSNQNLAPHFALNVTIVGINPSPPGATPDQERTGLAGGATWILEEGDLALYEDRDLTRLLHAFPRPSNGQQPAAADEAEANGAEAARVWGLPTLKGTPVVVLDRHPTVPAIRGDAYEPPLERDRPAFPAAIGPWARAIHAITLAATPDPTAGQTDEQIRLDACIFLSRDERALTYGRDAAFGNERDVCAPPSAMDRAELIALFRTGAATFKARDLPNIQRRAPHLPLRLLAVTAAELGPFDPQRGGFPLRGYNSTTDGTRLFDVALDFKVPELWPIGEREAANFESSRANSSRTVFIGVPVTILSAAAATAPGGVLDANPQRLQLAEGVPTLYADPGLTRPMHRFGPDPAGSTGSAQPVSAPVADTAAAANAVVAARQWNLPTSLGLPVISPDLSPLQNYSPNRPDEVAWQKTLRALSLSLRPQQVADMPPERILAYTCLFLPPSRVAALQSAPYCRGGGVGPGQEFAATDAAATFRARDLPPILAAAPRLPFDVLLVKRLRPATWDRARGGFALDGSSYDPAESVFGTKLDVEPIRFWPATEAEARAFVASQPPPNPLGADRDRGAVFLARRLTLTGFKPPAALAQSEQLEQFGWTFEARGDALYGDPALTRKLYDFGIPPTFPKPIIGTPAAEAPKPAGPVPFDGESVVLAAIKSGVELGRIDWDAVAQRRRDREAYLLTNPRWSQVDPWGVFFPGDRASYRVPPADVLAFRAWSERRAAALPETLVKRTGLRTNAAGQTLAPFEWLQYLDPKPAVMTELARRGLPAEHLVNFQTIEALSSNVIAALPRPRDNYNLAVGPIPERPLWAQRSSSAEDAARLETELVIDGIDLLEATPGSNEKSTLLLRLQPRRTVVRAMPGDRIIAEKVFAPVAWPTAALAAPAPPLWPAAVPGPAAQALAAPYGAELSGIRLGMTLAEAEAAIRQRMQVGQLLDFADPTGVEPPEQKQLARALSGRTFVAKDLQHRITVLVSRVEPIDRVVAVWQRSFIPAGGWTRELATLSERYGTPVQSGMENGMGAFYAAWSDRSFIVGGALAQCAARSEVWRWTNWTENGQPRPLRVDAVEDIPVTPALRQTEPAPLDRCSPVLRVNSLRTNPGDNQPEAILASLFDLRLLAWLRDQVPTAPPRSTPATLSANTGPRGLDPQLANGPFGPDVVGLRLGMTMEEAETAVRAHMPVAHVFETAPPTLDAATSPTSFFRGRAFLGEDRPEPTLSERIVLFEGPPEAAGRVIFISRTVFVGPELAEELRSRLQAKYGQPNGRVSIPSRLRWTSERDCVDPANRASLLRWQRIGETGGPPNQSLPNGFSQPPAPLDPKLQNVFARCGMVVAANLGQEGGYRMNGPPLMDIQTEVFDVTLLARLLRHQADKPQPAVDRSRVRL